MADTSRRNEEKLLEASGITYNEWAAMKAQNTVKAVHLKEGDVIEHEGMSMTVSEFNYDTFHKTFAMTAYNADNSKMAFIEFDIKTDLKFQKVQ